MRPGACGNGGVQAAGCQLVRHVELRGRRDCLAEVLLVSRAVLQLSTTATSAQAARWSSS